MKCRCCGSKDVKKNNNKVFDYKCNTCKNVFPSKKYNKRVL